MSLAKREAFVFLQRVYMTDFLSIALALIARGFKVTPLEGKRPFLPDWNVTASDDPAVIAHWATKYPNHNVGVVTSEKSWSIDVDHMAWFQDNAPWPLPKTLVVKTGSGKLHIHFKGPRPDNLRQVKNPNTGEGQPVKLLEFPDQVVGVGSVHPDTGKPYTIFQDEPLSECPATWLRWLRSLHEKKAESRNTKLIIRPDWNPVTELRKAGLKFTERQDGDALYLDYHALMQRCLTRKDLGPHHSNGQVDGKRQSCFKVRQVAGGWDLTHQCFSCESGRNTSDALAALGINLQDIVVKAGGRSYRVVWADSITPKPRVYLWPGYLSRNKLTHFVGASAMGKSPVTCDLTARVSAGLLWPDKQTNTWGAQRVILMAGEDDWSDTIVPRLTLAGADLKLVGKFVSTQITKDMTEAEVSVRLDEDMSRLQDMVADARPGMIVIDPITNYLGAVRMNREEEVRSLLMPLANIAQEFDCCVITVGHTNRRDKEATVMQRIMGAAAFGGVARDVFVFGEDPENDEKYHHIFGELRNSTKPALKYHTEAVSTEWGEVIRVVWDGEANVDLDQVINPPKQQDKKDSLKASEFIRDFCKSGAQPTKVIEDAMKDAGIECKDFAYAARRFCKSRQIKGKGKSAGWEWFLPTSEQIEFDTNRELTNAT